VLLGSALSLMACGGIATMSDDDVGQGGAGAAPSPASATVVVSSSATVGGGGVGGMSPRGGAPPIPPLVSEDYGSVTVGEELLIEVPDNALGFTVYASAPSNADSIGIERIVAPNDTVLVQDFVVPGTLSGYLRPGIVTAAVPVSDAAEAMPPMPGTWKVTLASETDLEAADFQFWYRQTLDGEFHGGLIDINVFMVPGAGTEESVTDLLHLAFDDWAGGLNVGEVSFFALSSEFSIVTEANYFDLFAASAPAAGKPALNFLLVDFIDLESEPLGFSPGAPALPLEHGTLQSGVVVTLADFPALDRVVFRHETGHFAGLFHTTEIEVGYGDKLSDTPVCANVLDLFESCPDFDNLMFPFANPDNPMLMSDGQDAVVRGSALYRGAVEKNGGFPEPLARVAGGDGDDDSATGESRAPLPWSSRGALPARAERLLAGHWCHRARVSPARLLAQIPGVDPAALLAVGQDPLAPDYVRMRALSVAGRMDRSATMQTALAAIKSDATIGRRVRVGARVGLRQP